MALKPFPPGVSGNPSGRPKVPESEKILRKLSREQFAGMAEMIVLGEWTMIAAMAENENETGLKRLIAQCLVKAHFRGDWLVVDKLLDRLIGKPKEDIEVTHFRRVVRKLDGTSVEYTTQEKESD
jgi:hypothetical protein